MRGRDAGVVGLVMHSITLHRPQVASPGPSGRTNGVVGQAITACGGVAPRRWASVRGAVERAAAGARLGFVLAYYRRPRVFMMWIRALVDPGLGSCC